MKTVRSGPFTLEVADDKQSAIVRVPTLGSGFLIEIVGGTTTVNCLPPTPETPPLVSDEEFERLLRTPMAES
jgi:hypothetical protein